MVIDPLDMSYQRVQVPDPGGHVRGVGVHDPSIINHHPDMPWPEDEIAAGQRRVLVFHDAAEASFLHIGIPRAGDAAGLQGELNQRRTIQTLAGPAAPKVGDLQEPKGLRRRILAMAFQRSEVVRGDPCAVGDPAPAGLAVHDAG